MYPKHLKYFSTYSNELKSLIEIFSFSASMYNLLLFIWTYMKTLMTINKHTWCLIPKPTLLMRIVMCANSRKLTADNNERRLLAKFQSRTAIDVPTFRYGQLVRLYGRIQEPHSNVCYLPLENTNKTKTDNHRILRYQHQYIRSQASGLIIINNCVTDAIDASNFIVVAGTLYHITDDTARVVSVRYHTWQPAGRQETDSKGFILFLQYLFIINELT
ncbi:hypothetical protein AGLY_015558 [Aphis glycines]|uniref:Uncharacterized protein n=1 Tax=Aphis glycines TaxID=307491 RepID=A0A6G0T2E6_APHGL|nr:hypothetical protein AGLY_015558 [Aphis glycines]